MFRLFSRSPIHVPRSLSLHPPQPPGRLGVRGPCEDFLRAMVVLPSHGPVSLANGAGIRFPPDRLLKFQEYEEKQAWPLKRK